MDQLIADFVSRMGLALPVAILVAVRAGRMIHQMNSQNMETKVTDLTINVVKEKIVDQLSKELRVYRETTEDVNLPTGVNLQEGTQSEYFVQVIQFLGGSFFFF
ncbi:hypothetical protein OIU78_014724 [Salix suchowensis]|nr:hypothetical protein OIU78_014724 [Salix suchowensis]